MGPLMICNNWAQNGENAQDIQVIIKCTISWSGKKRFAETAFAKRREMLEKLLVQSKTKNLSAFKQLGASWGRK
jgi:hypothetical protein